MPQGGSDRVRDLIKAVEASDIEEVTVEDAGMRITIRKGGRALSDSGFVQAPFNRGVRRVAGCSRCRTARRARVRRRGVAVEAAAHQPWMTLCIASRPPWSAPSTPLPLPNDPPYVEVGHTCGAGDVLCILEAMKLMNEVVSEVSGTVQAVLVADGAAGGVRSASLRDRTRSGVGVGGVHPRPRGQQGRDRPSRGAGLSRVGHRSDRGLLHGR